MNMNYLEGCDRRNYLNSLPPSYSLGCGRAQHFEFLTSSLFILVLQVWDQTENHLGSSVKSTKGNNTEGDLEPCVFQENPFVLPEDIRTGFGT